jgi:putative MATE family efflux protein
MQGEEGATSPDGTGGSSSLLDMARQLPMWKVVFSLAWPVLIQQGLVFCVGMFDSWLAGNFKPQDEALHVPYQSAQTNANYLIWFIASCSAIVSIGSTALVARFVGARDRDAAIHVTNQAIFLALAFGVFGTIVGLLSISHIIHAMRLDGPAAEMAIEFLMPILLLWPMQMIEQAGIACLIGAGNTRIGLYVLGGVALLNIPLAYICFRGIGSFGGFGFQGIAIGTALSHTLGAIAVMLVLAKGQSGLRLKLRWMVPNWGLIRRILRVSIPATIDVLSICFCQLWFLGLVNEIGNTAITAHGHAIRWESLGYLSGQAFAVAATALVGQNLGAKRPEEASRCGWTALGLGAITMTLMGVIFYVFAPQMFEFFSPFEHQRDVITEGVPVLRLVAFSMPSLACIIILTGALRGAGDTRVPVLLTWIGFLVVRIPLAYWLIFPSVDLGSWGVLTGMNLGLYGAWLAMQVDLQLRGILFLLRFGTGGWKKVRV